MILPTEIPSDLAVEIEGDLTPEEFLAAARHFFGYIQDVARISLGADNYAADWKVRVREGSTILAVDPPTNIDQTTIGQIAARITSATKTLAAGSMEFISIGESALNHIKALSAMTIARGDERREIRLWIKRTPVSVVPEIAQTIREDWRTDYNDYGTVEGKLEAIQDSGGLKLRIRDVLYNRAINCSLPNNLLEKALGCFRSRVEVSGLIHYRKNGIPINIEVATIEPLPNDDDLPSASDVRGIFKIPA
jgi:hypothetical protein